jgi:hypothetical protein
MAHDTKGAVSRSFMASWYSLGILGGRLAFSASAGGAGARRWLGWLCRSVCEDLARSDWPARAPQQSWRLGDGKPGNDQCDRLGDVGAAIDGHGMECRLISSLTKQYKLVSIRVPIEAVENLGCKLHRNVLCFDREEVELAQQRSLVHVLSGN